VDLTLVPGDDCLDERKAETGAASIARTRCVEATEALEDALSCFEWHACAVVVDAELDAPVGCRRCAHTDLLVGVASSIGDEVFDHTSQLIG